MIILSIVLLIFLFNVVQMFLKIFDAIILIKFLLVIALILELKLNKLFDLVLMQ
jgi:hypothetical protein